MPPPDIVLCAPVRTPIGSNGGSLKETPAFTLGAAVIRENQDRWATHSQQRFSGALAAGKLAREILALEISGRKGLVRA